MDIRKKRQLAKAAFYCLLISSSFSLTSTADLVAVESATAEPTAAKIKLTPRWTERYLFKYNPELLRNTHLDQVLSFYYFGSFQNFTIMGMERVKGEDYHQYNTVLIFKDLTLHGYYEELAVFPASVNEQGVIKFPANNDVIKNIDLGQNYYPAIIFSRDKKLNPETHDVSEFLLNQQPRAKTSRLGSN